MHYRPEIDGLRAVAVVPVILFHAGFPAFAGGFVGVDVFFVISGYLITALLLADLDRGRFSLATFYERRARRILPALFFVMACCIPPALIWMLPGAFQDFAEAAGTVALFLSNFLFIEKLDYFAPAAETNPLLHTWSLAVEEQFYIVFPPILWALWRMGGTRLALAGTLVLALASFGLSEWAWRAFPAQNFFFSPSRAWELLAGAFCAFALRDDRWPRLATGPGGAWRDALALAGLAAIGLAVAVYDTDTPFPSVYALLPVAGAALIILFARPSALVTRLLSLRAMVGIGLISFSAYLWHQPLFAFARVLQGAHPGGGVMLALSALSLLLAALTWAYVEQPFRTHGTAPARLLSRRWQVFGASGVAIAGFTAFGIWGHLTDGRADIWLTNAAPMERQTYLLLEAARAGGGSEGTGPCRFDIRALTPEITQRLQRCRDQHGAGVAILGDSHAIDLARALLENSAAPFLFGLSRGGCRPDAPDDGCSYDAFATLVADEPGLFTHVVFELAGQHLLRDSSGRSAERLFARFAPEQPLDLADIRMDTQSLGAVRVYLERLVRHVPVIWLTPRIEPHLPDSYIIAKGCDFSFDLRDGMEELFTRLSDAVRTEAQGTGIEVLDQMAVVDFTMPEDFTTCDAHHWTDTDHLSRTGRAIFGIRLAPYLLPAPGTVRPAQ